MKIVFMGSAELSCVSLRALVESGNCDVVGVVTQPDRTRGRNRKVQPSLVKEVAVEYGLPVFTPEKVNTDDAISHIRQWNPDLAVVVAYGQILKPAILELPKFGCINVHTSLLPAYRGASPIQTAIVNGDRESGVTIMYMDEGMDTGDIMIQATVPIASSDTASDLHDRLAEEGAQLLVKAVDQLEKGHAPRIAQDHAQASHCSKLTKEDGRIDWSQSTEHILNKIRGYFPWPGSWSEFVDSGKTLKILKAEMAEPADVGLQPGVVTVSEKRELLIATSDSAVKLLDVQPEGKKAMNVSDFLNGYPLASGARLN